MRGLQVALTVGGPLAAGLAWGLVRSGRASIWAAMGTLYGVLGAVSAVAGGFEGSTRFETMPAVLVGLGAGVELYASTAAFMAVARRWPPLARHTSKLYRARADVPLWMALVVSVGLTAAGEELLWRGVVLSVLGRAAGGPAIAAAATWSVYMAANALSGSLPIVLGAAVGGAVWTALAWWTGGVAASIACHAAWTALMVLRPPPGAGR